jgi:hypothetical protein
MASDRSVRPSRVLATVVLAAVALSTAFVVPAWGQTPELGIKPVDQAGRFFELTMAPGERRELAVELANHGETAVPARTYRADVYSIVNGGFGARLEPDPDTGATLWVAYAEDVLELDAGSGVTRTFSVTVPPDAAAGEYITSLVVENEDPVRGSGNVAVDQVVRQAIAVVVTVPGAAVPALEINEANHALAAGNSVVAVGLANTGNVRLQPAGEVVVADSDGREVSRTTVTMESVYAGTATSVEAPQQRLLEPGRYSVRIVLDYEGGRAEAESLALTVPVVEELPVRTPEDAADGDQPSGNVADNGVPTWVLIGGVVGLLVLGIVLGRALPAVLRRKRTAPVGRDQDYQG